MLRTLLSAALVVGLLAPLPVPAEPAKATKDGVDEAMDLDAIPPPGRLPPQTAKVVTDALPERKPRLGPRARRIQRELRRVRNERRRELEEIGLTRLPSEMGAPGPGRTTPVRSPDGAWGVF